MLLIKLATTTAFVFNGVHSKSRTFNTFTHLDVKPALQQDLETKNVVKNNNSLLSLAFAVTLCLTPLSASAVSGGGLDFANIDITGMTKIDYQKYCLPVLLFQVCISFLESKFSFIDFDVTFRARFFK